MVLELLITPVATLAGVIITFVGTAILQGRQEKRVARTRYHGARYEAYRQYMRLANRALYSEEPPSEDQVEEIYAEIGLIGTDNASRAALNVYMNVVLYLRQRESGTGDSHTRQAVKKWLDHFTEVARKELEVPDE